jgi:hypothetical protein
MDYYVVEHQPNKNFADVDGPFEEDEAREIAEFMRECYFETIASEYEFGSGEELIKREEELTGQKLRLVH